MRGLRAYGKHSTVVTASDHASRSSCSTISDRADSVGASVVGVLPRAHCREARTPFHPGRASSRPGTTSLRQFGGSSLAQPELGGPAVGTSGPSQ